MALVIAAVLIAVIVVGVYAVTRPKDVYYQTIPAGMGISGTCDRPIHTHDTSGTLHVETDQDYTYKLGDFFLVWGKVFNSSGIFQDTQPLPPYLGRCISGTSLYHAHPFLTIIYNTKAPSGSLNMTVNGSPEPLLQNLQLTRDSSANPQNIVITYGPNVHASF